MAPTFVLVALIAACSVPHHSGAWTQWRGPQRDGVTSAFSAPQNWPQKLALQWKIAVGSGLSSPVVADQKVYVLSRLDGLEGVSCLDLNKGELLWRSDYAAAFQIPDHYSARVGQGPKSTPVLHQGKLYTLGISGILSCYEASSGRVLWRKTFADRFAKTHPFYGTSMSPLVVDNRVIVHVGGADHGAILALDTRTGTEVWRWAEDGPSYASPILCDLEGTTQLITQTQHWRLGLDATTGALLWQTPFTSPYDETAPTPVRSGANVIFAGLEGGATALHIARHDGTWTAKEIWHNAEAPMYMNSPVLGDGLLFGLSHRRKGHFFALDPGTGQALWTSPPKQAENAAIVGAGRFFVVLTTDAELLIVANSTAGFDLLARYEVAQSPTWAHPLLLGRQILIRDQNNLYLWSLK